jgi:hypothetical protein
LIAVELWPEEASTNAVPVGDTAEKLIATRPVPPFTRREVNVLVPPWLVGVDPSKESVPLSVLVTDMVERTT